MCSESSDEVVPGAVVYSVSGEGSILSVSGPFSCGHSHLEVGQGGSDFLRVVTVDVKNLLLKPVM